MVPSSHSAHHLQVITADFTQYDFEEKAQYADSLVHL
jgi:hypothetical protein